MHTCWYVVLNKKFEWSTWKHIVRRAKLLHPQTVHIQSAAGKLPLDDPWAGPPAPPACMPEDRPVGLLLFDNPSSKMYHSHSYWWAQHIRSTPNPQLSNNLVRATQFVNFLPYTEFLPWKLRYCGAIAKHSENVCSASCRKKRTCIQRKVADHQPRGHHFRQCPSSSGLLPTGHTMKAVFST